MKRFIKIVFAVLFIVCSCIFSAIFVVSKDISQSYKVNKGEELSIDSVIPITTVYKGVKTSQETEVRHIGESYEVDLKIFGVIPFSTVNVEIVDETYVQVLGNPFGMKIYTDGVLVIESSGVKSENGTVNPAKQAGIKVGDYIKKANGKKIYNNEDLLDVVTQSNGEDIKIEALRNGKNFTCNVKPILDVDSNAYRIGIWVRDSSAGIGTLTFYNPSNDVICGLGHGICDSDTETLLEIEKGEIVEANIVSVEKGSAGNPGSLKGKLTYNNIADILTNCEMGVYGICKDDISSVNLTKVALKQEVVDGNAQILCTVNGNTPKLYSCEIEQTGKNLKTQNMIVKITDKELINAAGGIVQGMSGSPILQDGKLVGALTHVLVDDSLTGYGIYAENMLEMAKSVAENNRLNEAA